MTLRIADRVQRRDAASISVDGRPLRAFTGETLAAALFASGIRQLRRSPRSGAPRGMFCMMGVCQECLVRVDGRRALACQTGVRDGMTVMTGDRS